MEGRSCVLYICSCTSAAARERCPFARTYLHQEDLGVVVEQALQALEVPCLTFRGERHLLQFRSGCSSFAAARGHRAATEKERVEWVNQCGQGTGLHL